MNNIDFILEMIEKGLVDIKKLGSLLFEEKITNREVAENLLSIKTLLLNLTEWIREDCEEIDWKRRYINYLDQQILFNNRMQVFIYLFLKRINKSGNDLITDLKGASKLVMREIVDFYEKNNYYAVENDVDINKLKEKLEVMEKEVRNES